MDPVQIDLCNMIYQGDGAEVGDLPCRREQPGEIHAYYKPGASEIAALQAGGLIRLRIHSEPIPPVGLDVLPRARVRQNGRIPR